MIKVEMKINPTNEKNRAFAFTASSEDDLETLDAIRVAMLNTGTMTKDGGYATSNRLIIEVTEH